jgi:outer membrane protein, heavy metal efflux system
VRLRSRTLAVCAVVCLHASLASAQRPLSLAAILSRAREHAPQIVSARLAVDEARGRLVGASLRLQTNPDVEVAVGSRQGPDRRSTDVDIGVSQLFEPGARRSARMAGANAAIAQASANLDEITRVVLRAAAAAYYRALHADARIRQLATAQDLAAAVHAAADRRFRAGDIAVLDVNIARASLGRVRAEREAGEAARALALGELRQLLGLEAEVTLEGSWPPPDAPDLTAALEVAAQRPEIRALEAGLAEADADLRAGLSFLKPDYGIGVRYAREGSDHIVLGGLTLTLPVFSKGQEQRALASARMARLRVDLDAARLRVRLEVRAAYDACLRRLAAVRVLETDAMAGLDENERLTVRSFESGQIGLPELLLIRRETLDTRFQYLDALLEAALARIDFDASAARLR